MPSKFTCEYVCGWERINVCVGRNVSFSVLALGLEEFRYCMPSNGNLIDWGREELNDYFLNVLYKCSRKLLRVARLKECFLKFLLLQTLE